MVIHESKVHTVQNTGSTSPINYIAPIIQDESKSPKRKTNIRQMNEFPKDTEPECKE